MEQVFQSWVHGNSVLLERLNAPAAISKDSALAAYSGREGDLVRIGEGGGAACFRIGCAARFVVLDLGPGDSPKSGSFWVHYAIPTSSIHSGVRSRANRVLVNYESSNVRELSITKLHIWDGNRRIFANEVLAPPSPGSSFDGGIPGCTTDSSPPDMSRLLRCDLQKPEIFFGLGVSLLISARAARSNYLQIRGVGVQFASEDRT